jgi:hypothetical protein
MTKRSGRIEARVELARRTRPRPTGRGFLFAGGKIDCPGVGLPWRNQGLGGEDPESDRADIGPFVGLETDKQVLSGT